MGTILKRFAPFFHMVALFATVGKGERFGTSSYLKCTDFGVGGLLASNISGFNNLLKNWRDEEYLTSIFVGEVNKHLVNKTNFKNEFYKTSLHISVLTPSFKHLISNLTTGCAEGSLYFLGPGLITFPMENKGFTLKGTYTLNGTVFENRAFKSHGSFSVEMTLICDYMLDVYSGKVDDEVVSEGDGFCYEGKAKASVIGDMVMENLSKESINLHWVKASFSQYLKKVFERYVAEEYPKLFTPAFDEFKNKVMEGKSLNDLFNYGY